MKMQAFSGKEERKRVIKPNRSRTFLVVYVINLKCVHIIKLPPITTEVTKIAYIGVNWEGVYKGLILNVFQILTPPPSFSD